MKKYSIIYALIILLLPLFSAAQEKAGFTIEGHLQGLKEGEKVTLRPFYHGKYTPVLDSAFVKNGTFKLIGIIPDGPRYVEILFDKHTEGLDKKVVRLLLDNNENITLISGDINLIEHNYIDAYIQICGSQSNEAYRYLRPAFTTYVQNIKSIDNALNKLKDSVGFNPDVVGELLAEKQKIHYLYNAVVLNDQDFAQAKNLYSTYTFEYHLPYLAENYNNLSEKEKNSFYGQKIKERVPLSVSQPFPDFNLPTLDGKMVSSKAVSSKSKLTLIHFWASNSVDREQYQQELRLIYKKYNAKGLSVIGVSSDKNMVEYKARVMAEEYPWPTVSDLKGDEGIVGKQYFEYRNPKAPNTTNVLVDATGKIVAWDVYGLELEWYLWKYLDKK
ncbi:peroxiredoxin [Mucilaginibacter gracilis]|uniref:Peroxiredoxin n=1 Tax=Mucilaginibacter gracilis TaxID=423350 RepID=A0A495ITY3_9SPHI|nr:redoxin domain-containing protein [Mucilaginibacter gracilis]RKR79993.1 peroxiredoxin [Mucilaginibacter gracilis]